jgi:hypothetical protein
MSLEAIAALLGHRSMRMTMVYAKIAWPPAFSFVAASVRDLMAADTRRW